MASYIKDGLIFKKNYTTDTITDAMRHAINSAGGNADANNAADNYVRDMMGRIGTVSANTGKVLTAQDVQAELNRLGFKTNMTNANDATTKQGGSNDWMGVGTQQYLVGGQDYDWLKNNYNDLGLTNVNMYGGNTAKDYIPTNGNAIGSKSTPQELYQNAYERALAQELERIEGLKAQAAQQQNDQNRRAYIAMRQGQQALRNQAAASGLNDSGYSETSNVALMRDYGNNLNTINQDYLNYLAAGVDQQYTQTALQGAQYQYEQQLAALERARALEQQQYENAFRERQYADALAQQMSANNQAVAKQRADMAIELGQWNDDIMNYYGITPQQFNAYVANEKKKNVSDSEISEEVSYTPFKQGTPQQQAETIDANANARYIRNLTDKYGVSIKVVEEAIKMSKNTGISVDEYLAAVQKFR